MKKLIAILLTFVLILINVGCVIQAEEIVAKEKATFEDTEGSWAKEEIEYVINNGIMNGVGENKFAPEDEISKAQFTAVLFRLLKLSPIAYENIFTDISKDDWYADMVQTIYELDILNHDIFKGTFNGDNAITREEIASLVANGYLLFLEISDLKENEYKDKNEISDWALTAVNQVSNLGVMTGKEVGFAPKDKMTRAEVAAVIKRLLEKFQEKGLDTAKMTWQQAPVIFRLTDEVKPGDTLSIYGCGLIGKELKIWAETGTDNSNKPSEKALELNIIQSDLEGNYVTTILPENFQSGIAKIWVENKYGIGNSLLLNAARPSWVAIDIGYEGSEIQLIGNNFDLKRVGSNTATKVKFTNNKDDYEAEIATLEPYSVKFIIPKGIPIGEYKIAIANDGINWSVLENEQTFRIVEKGNDPYKLGVAWEKNYKYDNKVSITDFGAIANDSGDDTIAIQSAINKLDELGGGILIIPAGTFRFNKMRVPSYVIVAGEDRYKSKLIWTYDFEANAFNIAIETVKGKSGQLTGYNGFYNLTFQFDQTNPENKVPDKFTWIGDQWSNYTAVKSNDRKYEGFFFKDVTVDFPMDMVGGNHNVLRSYTIIKKYYLFDNCSLVGYQAPPGMPVYGNYVKMTNNYMDNKLSTTENVGSYSVWENNELIRYGAQFGPDGKRLQSQGIFIRANAYCAYNKIKSTGGDGESITTDANKQNVLMRGEIIDSTLNQVRVLPYVNEDGVLESIRGLMFTGTSSWDMSYPCFGSYSILICAGKGMGQLRKVTAADELTKMVMVDKPWDVPPDSSSKFTILSFNENVFMYKNHAEDTVVGFQLYGTHYDCVIADNTTENSLGLRTTAIEKRGVGSADSRFWPEFFITYRNNVCTGVSPESKDGTISIIMHYESKSTVKPFAYTGYGINIKGNTLQDVFTKSTTSYGNGIRIQTSNSTKFDQYIAKAINIESNTLMNILESGIHLGTSKARGGSNSLIKGVVVKDNIYQNVKKHKAFNDTADISIINE